MIYTALSIGISLLAGCIMLGLLIEVTAGDFIRACRMARDIDKEERIR